MVDIDQVGGVQVIVRELLEAGVLNGEVMTCTGETLAQQVKRLGTKPVDGTVIYPVAQPYKPTGGLRVLGGNLSPEFSAILKLAGVESDATLKDYALLSTLLAAANDECDFTGYSRKTLASVTSTARPRRGGGAAWPARLPPPRPRSRTAPAGP